MRAWRGGEELHLGSPHRRTVFAVLALAPGLVVARDELIDAVWGEQPPHSAASSIYTYISGLRRVLEPGRPPRSDDGVLASVGSGYVLRTRPEQVDVQRFHSLRASGAEHHRAGRPVEALADIESALALWRGDALADVEGSFAATQRGKLEELRLVTVEMRAELTIALGRGAGSVAELSSLCAAHPLRERSRLLLMRALHASGRTAEALRVFTDTRTTLVAASGVEPGPELRELHRRLIAGETTPRPGRVRAARGAAPPAPPAPPAERAKGFVGREAELTVLRTAVAELRAGRGGVVWVEGEPGIGKTALLAEALSGPALGTVRPHWIWPTAIATTVPEQRDADLLAGETTMILVVDDLQAADDPSLNRWARLATLVDRSPLLLISASRPVPGGDGLARTRRRLAGVASFIEVSPLDEEQAGQLGKRRLGAPVPAATVALAGGNPRYLNEILAVDGTSTWQRSDAAGRELPSALAARIVGHLAFLSEPALVASRWAAVLGAEFSGAELASALDRPPTELSEPLAEAASLGILIGIGEDRFRFRHDIVRLALYETIPAAVRCAVHRQFAELLDRSGVPPPRVATHLAASGIADAWTASWLAANVAAIETEDRELATRLRRALRGSPCWS